MLKVCEYEILQSFNSLHKMFLLRVIITSLLKYRLCVGTKRRRPADRTWRVRLLADRILLQTIDKYPE